MVAPQEAAAAAARGVPIVDIRPAEEYVEGRLPGAVNVPFYRSIEGGCMGGWEAVCLHVEREVAGAG